jgi:signal transduction histidine kinase
MMKKLLLFFLIVSAHGTEAQNLAYYSEKQLRTELSNAKTPFEKISALGKLGVFGYGDSVIEEIYAIAKKSENKRLMAEAMRWDWRLGNSDDTTKTMNFLRFSEEQQLGEYQIAALLGMSDYHIHHNRNRSLYYATKADSVLKSTRTVPVEMDSLKIEVCRRFAHLYIHKLEGLNSARYLLELRNYGERAKTDALKMHALDILVDLYSEIDDTVQQRKSIPWNMILYDYYRKNREGNKLLSLVGNLASVYTSLREKDSANFYFNQSQRMADSLQVYGPFLLWQFEQKSGLGLISLQQAIRMIDNNFDNRWILSPRDRVVQKIRIYTDSHQMDSAASYLSKLKKIDINAYQLWLKLYYLQKKDYKNAIPLLEKEEKEIRADKWLLAVYKDLIDGHKSLGDYKKAFEYQLRYNNLKDSLDQLRSVKEVVSMEMEKQIELQRAAFDDEQAKTSLRNRIRIYAFIAGLAALLAVALILWKNNQRKQKDKVKIEQAYNELKSTQQQLIQSEKMASLGELTAGIAHEIQNPLNFVNNFSEVSNEMIDEMNAELNKGDSNEAKVIAAEIKQNLEKINHHGKRADAIVKNMLQHSRSNSGVKEPTSINALSEEYLRLAYHGQKAKDKSFSATTKTDFDETVGNIKIIPQDIGRVILNLINNAFYAVDEKRKQNLNGYEPTVSVSTKKEKDKIEIKVKDNGNGIPKKVLDKIFQPFFTTKPTGQGTGLGLSLSYDIVKAHGGEIKVETKEGEGSEFIIQLPANITL